jgi:hypothetical protein
MNSTRWWINDLNAVEKKVVDKAIALNYFKSAKTPSHQMIVDNSELHNGSPSIQITSKIEGAPSWEGGIEYAPGSIMDFSNYGFVSFWMKFESLDSIARVYCQIDDVNGNYKKWEITDVVGTDWKRVTLDLESPSMWKSVGDLNFSLISGIQITFEKKTNVLMNSTRWWINDLNAVPVYYSRPEYISEVIHMNELNLYKIDDDHFSPIIYGVKNYTIVADIPSLVNTLAFSKIDPRTTGILLKNDEKYIPLLFKAVNYDTNVKPPKITFDKINPTKYHIKIQNSTDPFILIFSSTYDKNWKIYKDDSGVFNLFINEYALNSNHFIINGYANAWYIDKEGTYDLTLEFEPQNIFYLSLFISSIFIIVMLIYFSKNMLYRLLEKTYRSTRVI